MKTFLILFTNGAIRQFDVPDGMYYYRHTLVDALNKNHFISFGNLIIASKFINTIEDITEEVK